MDNGLKGHSPVLDTHTLGAVEFVAAHQNLLASLPIFAGIPFHQLEGLLAKCVYKCLQPKDLILEPGLSNHYLYLLLEGQLTVHIENLESDNGFQVHPGEFVGEVSIIDGQYPTAYVAASEPSLLLCIHETLLWADFFQIPGVARNMLRQFAGRMRARNAAIQKSVEQSLRLAHLENELAIAQALQTSMLPYQPFFPNHPQVDVDAFIKPAKEIGGDLYDAFPLDAQRICIAIGDVAGKGIPAALFMVRSLTLLRTEMLKTKDLLQTIHAINATLSEDNPTCMFLTLMICIVDTQTGLLEYVNGGHNRPVFGNFNGGFQFLAQPKGILVGISPKAVYQTATRQLCPGDMLVLFTDGITEAMSPAQEEFTERRLLDYINGQKGQTASSMISLIRDAVYGFTATAEQSDDLTLLVLSYGPNKA